MKTMTIWVVFLGLSLIPLLSGCFGDDDEGPAPEQTLSPVDNATPEDGSPGLTPDATTPDATTPDAATPDATPEEATPDATPEDATPDAATPDVTPDETTPDAATPEATPDATTPNATPDEATPDTDLDGDGYSIGAGDCDDTDPNNFPGNAEVCDEADNNCDQRIDEDLTTDADGDGHSTSTSCSGSQDDCDDTDPNSFPGNNERCDGTDNDCDGAVDDGLDVDADGDGYTTPASCGGSGDDCDDGDSGNYPGNTETCDGVDNNCDDVSDEGFDSDMDGYTSCNGDCDDGDADIHPAAAEICDLADNNCDGTTDEGVEPATWYADGDGDDYGTAASTTVACDQPVGYVATTDDCNDGDPAIYPSAAEICDGIDNNCDGIADEALPLEIYYQDSDGDGYGTSEITQESCRPPDGYVSTSGDCNDSDSSLHPDAVEVCDLVDNNCDGAVDEGLDTDIYYQDNDGDGYGSSVSVTTCAPPVGYVSVTGDCNDGDDAVHPDAIEQAGDSVDQDCDGGEICYRDADNDGYRPDENTTVNSNDTDCNDAYEALATDPTGDCNDYNSAIRPDATEYCDGIDNDCDGVVDDGVLQTYYRDADGDGYGTDSDTQIGCSAQIGYVATAGDCDDLMESISPDGYELCNGFDDDCDGLIDTADGFDVQTGTLAAYNEGCDGYTIVMGGEVPKLYVSYKIGQLENAFNIYDSIIVGGHNADAGLPSGWPGSCYYFDDGVYWWGVGNDSSTYISKACFSKGSDAGGQDEFYLEIIYANIRIDGVFNNETDEDGPELDYVYWAEEESTPEYEVWYVSDSSQDDGPGFSASLAIYDARIIIPIVP